MSSHLGAGKAARSRCVYCGRRTDEQPPNQPGRYRRHPLACWKHASLVALDHELSPPVEESVDDMPRGQVCVPRMLETADDGRAVQSARERAT